MTSALRPLAPASRASTVFPAVRWRWVLWILVLGLVGMWWNAANKKRENAPLSQHPVTRGSLQSGGPAESPTLSQTGEPNIPAHIQREAIEPAARDPFVAYQPPAPAAPKTPAVQRKAASPPPAPVAVAAPSPPVIGWRVVGQMTTPDGARQIFVSEGAQTLMLVPGQILPSGYQVVRIEPRQVVLLYPPLNYSTQLPLPEPPHYEVR